MQELEDKLVHELSRWTEVANCAYSVPYVKLQYDSIISKISAACTTEIKPDSHVVTLYKNIKYGALCSSAALKDIEEFKEHSAAYPPGHLALACIKALLLSYDDRYRAKYESRYGIIQ